MDNRPEFRETNSGIYVYHFPLCVMSKFCMYVSIQYMRIWVLCCAGVAHVHRTQCPVTGICLVVG